MSRIPYFNRIGYVYIPTPDIDASIAWYTGHLEFNFMEKFHDRGSLTAVLRHPHKNSVALLLVETAESRPLEITRAGAPYPVLSLNSPNIERTRDRLLSLGGEVGEIQVQGAEEAKYFYFRDNAGNLLEATWSMWDAGEDQRSEYQENGIGD